MSKPIYSVDVYLYVHRCFPHADAEWWGGMRRQLSCLVGNTYVICAQVKTRARSDRSGRARCFVFALHHFHVDGSRKRQKGAHLISFQYAHHIYCILYSKYSMTLKWRDFSIPIGVPLFLLLVPYLCVGVSQAFRGGCSHSECLQVSRQAPLWMSRVHCDKLPWRWSQVGVWGGGVGIGS